MQLEYNSKIQFSVISRAILLCFVIFLSSLGFAQYTQKVSAIGLKAYWKLDGNAIDQVINGNNGVLYNATPTADRWGNAGKALHFSSENDSVYFPTSFYTNPNSNFTISFWLKTNSFGRMQPVNMNDSGLFLVNLNLVLNYLQSSVAALWNGPGNNIMEFGTEGEFNDNKWHNILLTRNDTVLRLYKDGILKSSINYSQPISINRAITLSGRSFPFDGDLDEFTIYNRGFSQADVDTIATNNYVNRLMINSPLATDAYPVNTNCNIEWKGPAIANFYKLEYSLENSGVWNLLADSVSSDSSRYAWSVPNEPGKKYRIRIKCMENDSVYGITPVFLVSKFQWTCVNPEASFTPRDGSGAYCFRDTMYLIGGWDPYNPIDYPLITNNDVWWSVDGFNWQLKAIAPWEPRHVFGALVFDNKMWVLGGDQNQDHFQKDIWNSIDGKNWNLVTNNAPWGERVTHLTSVFNGKMWVMGGQKIVGPGLSNQIDTVYNDVWNSSDGVNWTQVTSSAQWSPRGQIEGYCVFKNKMWIIGGGTYDFENSYRKYFNDVWSSSDGVNWTLVKKDAPWSKRQYLEVCVYDNKLWVLGGFNLDGNRNDVWYSEDGITWIELKNTPWPVRHASSVYNYNKSLWVVAGNLWNDSWRLNNLACDSILSQPLSQTVTAGQTATFICNYSEGNADYSWQINNGGVWTDLGEGGRFTGVKSAVLKISNSNVVGSIDMIRCVINGGVCTDTSKIVSLKTDLDVGIMENVNQSEVKVYPNPTTGKFILKLSNASLKERSDLKVMDLNGRIVEETVIQSASEKQEIDLGDLKDGVYFLEVSTKNGSKYRSKILISKH